jgi:hypothetical protein
MPKTPTFKAIGQPGTNILVQVDGKMLLFALFNFTHHAEYTRSGDKIAG